MKQPNILWICTDHQRFDAIGCMGNPFVCTPNMDRLAGEGALFENCFAQNPFCAPSRSSFLTGRYPRTARCRQNGRSIPAEETLVTGMLSDQGYYGGLAGKLHISACHPSVAQDSERRIHDGYHEFHWAHDPGNNWRGSRYTQWLEQQGKTFSIEPRQDHPSVRTGMPAPLHLSTWIGSTAVDFIARQAGKDRPWHFAANFFDPHYPFDPPADYLERYMDRLDEIPLPHFVEGELEKKPKMQAAIHHMENTPYVRKSPYCYPLLSPGDHRMIRAAYWAMIDLLDEQVGRMMDALEETDQLEDTLVVFMSDHGEMLGDHGMYLKAGLFYEQLIHVPLILSWPGRIEKGLRSSALVELVDLAPTLLEAAGLERHPGMQGQSFLPIAVGEKDPREHREDVYAEFYNADFPGDEKTHTTMVRTSRYKVISEKEFTAPITERQK